MAEYRLAPAAERDLETIWRFTRRQWGTHQANRYAERLMAAFNDLASTPKIAPACDHIRPGYRRYHVGKHMVYFRLTDYGIAIIRILHERMNVADKL